MRTPLLVAAAALAMAVPGFLITACSSQAGGQAGGSSGGQTSSSGGGSAEVSTASPAAEATPAPSRRGSTAKASNLPGTAARQRAVQLLSQAAQAAVTTSYQGDEVATRWVGSEVSILVSDVWHASAGTTVTKTVDAGTTTSTRPYVSADDNSQTPEGVLDVTFPLVKLLESHYVVSYAGSGTADSRTAQIVQAWRPDGTLAGQFWLDESTKLPLEREVFDTSKHVVSRDEFLNVQIPAQPSAEEATPDAVAAPQTAALTDPQLLGLRATGWQVPAQLPGGLTLFTGAQTITSAGTVLDLGYSDGLTEVSLFEQHGKLADTLAGWRKATVDGHAVFVAESDPRSLTWSSQDMVFTVIADAPDTTLDAAVGALPHDKPPTFWHRMKRGVTRLVSMVNPFG